MVTDGRRCTPAASTLFDASRFGTPPHRFWPTSPSTSDPSMLAGFRRVPGSLFTAKADADAQFAPFPLSAVSRHDGAPFAHKRRWGSPVPTSAQSMCDDAKCDGEVSAHTPVAKRQRAAREAADAMSDEAHVVPQRVSLHAHSSSRASSSGISPLIW